MADSDRIYAVLVVALVALVAIVGIISFLGKGGATGAVTIPAPYPSGTPSTPTNPSAPYPSAPPGGEDAPPNIIPLNDLNPVFEIPGVVYTDIVEETDRLEVGVVSADLFGQVQKKLAELGIRRDMVDIVVAPPIIPVATLRDRVRPLQGGLQIAFSNFLCTSGFNAIRSGVDGFVVNSHCTKKRSSVESTAHYQPTLATDNFIGTEIADPPFFTGGVCPKGKKCRYSDSAYDQRASGVTADLGFVERTDSVNTGSLTIAGSFRIVGEMTGNAVNGETANKVGRTTGWTQGMVDKSCAHTAVFGTNIVVLCQDWVKAAVKIVGAGDSGSPIFKITNFPNEHDAELSGILWGGSSDGKIFVYSPMANVQRSDELGPISTCAAGFAC